MKKRIKDETKGCYHLEIYSTLPVASVLELDDDDDGSNKCMHACVDILKMEIRETERNEVSLTEPRHSLTTIVTGAVIGLGVDHHPGHLALHLPTHLLQLHDLVLHSL